MKQMLLFTMTLLLTLILRPGWAKADPPVYKPSETTIAVLPAINISSDKWKELKEKEAVKARETAGEIFARCGFQIMDAAKVDEALTRTQIDLHDETQWTKTNLYKIGKEAGADLVIFVLIKQTREKGTGNILLSVYQGEAEIEVWLVDARQERPLLNGEPARGHATGGARSATSRRLSAVQFAVDKGFANFLKSYAKAAKGKGTTSSNNTDKE